MVAELGSLGRTKLTREKGRQDPRSSAAAGAALRHWPYRRRRVRHTPFAARGYFHCFAAFTWHSVFSRYAASWAADADVHERRGDNFMGREIWCSRRAASRHQFVASHFCSPRPAFPLHSRLHRSRGTANRLCRLVSHVNGLTRALQRTAARLGSRTVRIICQRLSQPTGRFRRRSLSLIVRCIRTP